MKELRHRYLNQSAYDKKININLRNSQILKKNKNSNKKISKSRFKKTNQSLFSSNQNNSVEVTQNFSMVKGKKRGLENSVPSHSKFLNFNDDNFKKSFDIINKPPSQFFSKNEPQDYLDKVLNYEKSSSSRKYSSLSSSKYEPDLVEMVKSIFGPVESSSPSKSQTNFRQSLFNPSNQNKRKSFVPSEIISKPAFEYTRPKKTNQFQFGGSKAGRQIGSKIDCSDVLQHIRQRELYRRPLNIFQRTNL